MDAFENFPNDLPLDLLHELIDVGVLPESCDPAYFTPEDMQAYNADMQAMPIDIPTDSEIEAMAQADGFATLPF